MTLIFQLMMNYNVRKMLILLWVCWENWVLQHTLINQSQIQLEKLLGFVIVSLDMAILIESEKSNRIILEVTILFS